MPLVAECSTRSTPCDSGCWPIGSRPGAFGDAVRPGRTTLVIAETPSDPRLELCDLDEIGSIVGPFTVVDSTFATPIGQQPLSHGVDLVLHSATKGIAGHNDATLGVIAGERELVDAVWAYAVLHGAMASPFDSLNALRGVRTLAVRTAHQAATATRLADRLLRHERVTAVHYPGLESHPQHELATRQMLHPGTVLAFELAGGRPSAATLIDRLEVARCATSLGGPETLVCHPMTTTHAGLTPEERADSGVTDGLVRGERRSRGPRRRDRRHRARARLTIVFVGAGRLDSSAATRHRLPQL